MAYQAELPQNPDAEQATLGSLLLNREAVLRVAPWLRPGHFYREAHAWIYEAVLACSTARIPPDVRTVADQLRRHTVARGTATETRLDAVGGFAYLSELTSAVPTSYHVEHYAREVERVAVLRGLVTVGGRITALGYDQGRSPDDAIGDAQALLNTIGLGSSDALFQPLDRTIDAFYRKIERVQAGEATALGLPSGFRDLDDLTGGLHADELTLIAARPGVGKTSLMLSLAYNIAFGDADVLIASLEMNREQLLLRLIAMDTRIDTHRLRTLHLNEHELEQVLTSMGRLAAARVFLADIAAMTPADVRLGCLKHLSAHERPIVPIVDYLQLMGSTRKHENRVQDVSELSRACKSLARELHAPVIALSQLSRAVESRQDHRPLLSDLRESGSLEQDADNVWMLYREELYDKATDQKGIAELIVQKHRQGPPGTVPMRFDAPTTRFDDLTYRTTEGY